MSLKLVVSQPDSKGVPHPNTQIHGDLEVCVLGLSSTFFLHPHREADNNGNGLFASLLPLLKEVEDYKEMRSGCPFRQLELWPWDAGRRRKFGREKLVL